VKEYLANTLSINMLDFKQNGFRPVKYLAIRLEIASALFPAGSIQAFSLGKSCFRTV
jgi:hypothetical protein